MLSNHNQIHIILFNWKGRVRLIWLTGQRWWRLAPQYSGKHFLIQSKPSQSHATEGTLWNLNIYWPTIRAVSAVVGKPPGGALIFENLFVCMCVYIYVCLFNHADAPCGDVAMGPDGPRAWYTCASSISELKGLSVTCPHEKKESFNDKVVKTLADFCPPQRSSSIFLPCISSHPDQFG